MPKNFDDCYFWCQNNCSCVAYAYVDGIGCLVWSKDLIDILEFPDGGGEDLYLRLAHSELGENNECVYFLFFSYSYFH